MIACPAEPGQRAERRPLTALRVVDAQEQLAAYFEDEAKLSTEQIEARDECWTQSNARESIREEPW